MHIDESEEQPHTHRRAGSRARGGFSDRYTPRAADSARARERFRGPCRDFHAQSRRPYLRLGRSQVEKQLRLAFNYAFEPLDPDAHHFAVPKLAFRRITTEPFELLGQPIRPIRLLHGKLPILGFRINDVAYCTDVSQIPDESYPLLEGLDTLVIDALRDQPHPTHFSVGQALEVIERVKPRRAYFTHVSHSLEYEATNERLPENVELSYDGQRIAF
jgi:phosphoribosyl 1,2-cyclic phosphate phosphodiesterase